MMKRILCLLTAMIILAGCAGIPMSEVPEPTETPVTTMITEEDEIEVEENMNKTIYAKIGDSTFTIELEDNESTEALIHLLEEGERTVSCRNYGGFEKVCDLGVSLPSDDTQMTSSPGDVFLYVGSQIVIFHGSNSWSYTKLGHVTDISDEELRNILSGPETEITFSY